MRIMRKNLVLLLLLFGCLLVKKELAAQASGELPSFSMTLSNGHVFKSTDIPKGKPVVLIYFAPDCEHCQVLMNAFFKQTAAFERAEVILVTFKPVKDVAAFEQSFQTFRYPNIRVGTEGTTYFLRYYYRLQKTPFTALYNRKGKLVVSYREETPLNELAGELKKL